MKAVLVLLVLVLLQTQKSSAQNYWEHQVGVNYSYLGKSENEATPGLVYGLEKGWQLNEHLYLSSGAFVLIHNGTLLNESREPNEYPFYIHVIHINISYRLAYIGIPFILKYKLNLKRSLSLYLESGPQFNLCIYSGGNESLIKWEVFPRYEQKNYPISTRIEYGRDLRTVEENTGFTLNIGIGATLHRFNLKFLYSYPSNRIYNVGNFIIDEKMYIFSIILGYRIN